MTLEIGFLLLIVATMVALFLTEKLPVDLTAFAGLVVLVLAGYLRADEAFVGFASPAVITMLAIFIISASLLQTGLADRAGKAVYQLVGGSEVPLLVTLMVTVGLLSAFMNNIAATAVFMPAVAGICRSSGIPPSRLFMGLSFGAILGGTTTLVGTPPNILASEILREHGEEGLSLFAFAPVGLALLAAGVVYMVLFGRHMVPVREHATPQAASEHDLVRLYELQDRLFRIRVPQDSPLDGATLGEARLGTALGLQVVAVVRGGRRRPAPHAATRLTAGDVLVVVGRRDELERLLGVRGVEIEPARSDELPPPPRTMSALRLRLRRASPMVGKTLREARFRDRFGAVVLAVERADVLHRQDVGTLRLEAGDRLLMVGSRDDLEALAGASDFEVRRRGMAAVTELGDELFVMRVSESSPLAGSTLAASRIGELAGVTVAAVVRDGETAPALRPDETLRPGDRLLVSGEPARIRSLLELGRLEVEGEPVAGTDDAVPLESPDVAVLEATLAPRSSLAGKTPRGVEFRDRYGLQILALWREGEALHKDLAERPFRMGDALLLHGPRADAARLARDPDFVVLSPDDGKVRRVAKAPWALGGLLLMVALVVGGFQPIHVASFTAATAILLSGALTMPEAYRAIEWRAIFLVAAVLPVGTAMERTGAAELMASVVLDVAGPFGPYAVLAALVTLSSLLSQGLDGAPAVVLLAPVAIPLAEQMGVSVLPIMMGVGLAASAAFMTPFSHKANLIVMGAGGYRAMDYVKVGSPLTLVVLVLLVVLVPLVFPF